MAQLCDPVRIQLQGQQVRVGEIAVVVRLLLAAHGAALTAVGVEQARLLHHRAALLQELDLPPRLVFDGLLHEAHGVDVLGLGAGAERLSGAAHRKVHVAAHGALLHVAVAGAQIAQQGAQLAQVGAGLLGRANVGLGDDLHQRDAGAVEVDVGAPRVLVVQRLAGVLLQVQALDADVPAAAVRQIDGDGALADHRLLVLADLIALRQVGVEVVLPLEDRMQVDLGVEAEAGLDRLLDAEAVEHRQHAGHGRIDVRNLAVRLTAEIGGSAREELGL